MQPGGQGVGKACWWIGIGNTQDIQIDFPTAEEAQATFDAISTFLQAQSADAKSAKTNYKGHLGVKCSAVWRRPPNRLVDHCLCQESKVPLPSKEVLSAYTVTRNHPKKSCVVPKRQPVLARLALLFNGVARCFSFSVQIWAITRVRQIEPPCRRLQEQA